MMRVHGQSWRLLGAACLWALVFFAFASRGDSQEEKPTNPSPAPVNAVAKAPIEKRETSAEEGVVQQRSFLRFVFDASPLLFVLITAMSVYLGSVIVEGFRILRLAKVIPPQLVTKLDGLLNEKKYKEAYELVQGEKSLFAKALTAGTERLGHGVERATDAMLAMVEDGKIAFEHKVTPVATFGQLGPMLGLFGTVIGMILAFMTISSGEQVKTAKLAGEIAIALCATMEGLVLALPSIYFHAIFKNKIQRIIFEVEWLGERYLWRFASGIKR
ncbi:MAG: MotA/TolQ/ExbB proton channel family protein [Planctomycetota bacterium]